jgi:hypothetical protein
MPSANALKCLCKVLFSLLLVTAACYCFSQITWNSKRSVFDEEAIMTSNYMHCISVITMLFLLLAFSFIRLVDGGEKKISELIA